MALFEYVRVAQRTFTGLQADFCALNVRHVVISSGLVTTLAGSSSGAVDGLHTAALFAGPHDISIDAAGSFAIVVSVDLPN